MFRVIHFEISADNPDRAVKFYSSVFNWKIEKMGGPMDYRLATTGPKEETGINGAIMKRETPGTTTVNTIEVPSADEYLKKVAKAGGKALTAKMPIPGIGYFAYCQDTEGNTFGILQTDMAAK